ncbi:MAG: AbiV family abortive infection protein [Deltaproteobacteria bacterium]|nr:AbiV family abortive infection protein [Deltaproteobacteria bacterium]
MTNQESWIDIVTPNIKGDIERIAIEAYTNACDILKDAKILMREDRYARAGALVILSEEEFSKAFILFVCAQQNRWDSEIFYALKKHPEKQGIAKAMREYFEWFVDNYNLVIKMNQFAFVPATPSMLPSQKQWKEMIGKTKKGIKKEKKERYKQALLYVGFDRTAKVTSNPKNVNKKEVEDCCKEAERFKEVVEIALSGQIAGFTKIMI